MIRLDVEIKNPLDFFLYCLYNHSRGNAVEEEIKDLKGRVALLEKAVGILISRMNDLPVVTIKRSERPISQKDRDFMEYYNLILDELAYDV